MSRIRTMSFDYNIHNLIKISSDFELSDANRVSPAFDCFKCKIDQGEHDILIRNKKFELNELKDCNRLAHGLYYSNPDKTMISRLSVLGVDVCWGIKDLFGKTTTLYYNRPFYLLTKKLLTLPVSFYQPLFLLIRNLIQVKLMQKGASFIIGSAVNRGDGGSIFTGTTGSGKTTTMLACMEDAESTFVTNDLMIVSGKKVFGFPSDILYRKFSIGILSRHELIRPEQIFGNRLTSEIKGDCSIYFLERGQTSKISRIDFEDGINKLIYISNRIHPYFAERTLSAFSYLYDKFSILSTQGLLKDILMSNLIGAKFFILTSKNAKDSIALLKKT